MGLMRMRPNENAKWHIVKSAGGQTLCKRNFMTQQIAMGPMVLSDNQKCQSCESKLADATNKS